MNFVVILLYKFYFFVQMFYVGNVFFENKFLTAVLAIFQENLYIFLNVFSTVNYSHLFCKHLPACQPSYCEL